jgi:hypothetical protein
MSSIETMEKYFKELQTQLHDDAYALAQTYWAVHAEKSEGEEWGYLGIKG